MKRILIALAALLISAPTWAEGPVYIRPPVGVSGSGGSGDLTIGTSAISGGTSTRVLYDNAGVVGEYTISGSGTVVCMATGCVLVTPNIGAATGTSVVLSSSATALTFIPTGSSAPTNGLYLSAANTPAIAANSTKVLHCTSTGCTVTGTLDSTGNATAPNLLPSTTTNSGGVFGWDGTNVLTGAAVGAGLPVIGGGAGAAPGAGTRSGNTTAYVTTTGAQTSGDCVKIDANGNHIANGSACGGGSSTLNGITAATGAVTIASGNNTGIVWNWANTSNTTVAHTFGETTAATNGTSTTGVPNQVLLKATTLATSTMSPLSVYQRGAHVFSVDPTNPQILAASGSANFPTYAFTAGSSLGVGMYFSASGGDSIRFAFGGGDSMIVRSTQIRATSGTATAPGYTDTSNADTGFYWPASGSVATTNSTDGEWTRWSSRVMQNSSAKADAVGYALNFRKSRGTVASPTVLTTGDDLATISGYGYVGASNAYRQATSIRFDSTGTVSDATTGVGGNIIFGTMKQGVDTAAVDRFLIDQHGHPIAIAGTANTPTIGSACGTTPSITGTDDTLQVTIGSGGSDTSCVINFGTTWVATTVVCNVNSSVDATGLTTSATTSALTITKTAAFTAASKLNVHCRGIQ